jgi:preprotein translocase subunit Sec61beta
MNLVPSANNYLSAINKIKLTKNLKTGFHMAQQKETAPSGMAGLVRYEEEKSLVNIRPEYVFAVIGILSEIELVIQGLYLIAAAFGVLFGLMTYWLYRKNMLSKSHHAKASAVAQPPQPVQTSQPAQQSAQQDSVQQ